MIGVIDYGRGNLCSVMNSLKALEAEVNIANRPSDLKGVDRLIFPGVGAFRDCMDSLKKSGMDEAVVRFIEEGKPFLGICLGFQVLFEESEEFGIHKGFGIFKGTVRKFSNTQKVPHMGWNSIKIEKQNELLDGIPDGSYFYFVHSYYAQTPDETIVSCTTDYGINFLAMARRGNVFATQFHPEKSQSCGLRLLKNFIAF